jgi:transglutaminase-like putative cysteine protease
MPRLTVRHITTYRYKNPVAFGEHRVMFRPRDSYDQHLIHARLKVDPEPASTHWMHDVFGNCVAIICFAGRSDRLRFESEIKLDHVPSNALEFPIASHAVRYPFSYDQQDVPDLLRSMERQYPDRDNELTNWARRFLKLEGPSGTRDLLVAITKAVRRDFTYVRREEMGIQTPLQTLKTKSGSCRDFALLMIEAVRALGFAARFVSGYLYVPSRDGSTDAAHKGGGSTHAWVQVYVPGAGWMEFDPTNGIVGSHDLIRVAVARDPAQAVPLWGTWVGFPGDHQDLKVEVYVDSEPAPDQAQPPVASDEPAHSANVASRP